MQSHEEVYFLTVKQAQDLSILHENDENWDLWNYLENFDDETEQDGQDEWVRQTLEDSLRLHNGLNQGELR